MQSRDQGHGSYVPGRGAHIVELLIARNRPTLFTFADDTTLLARASGFVRDIGDDWEKLYLEGDGQTLLSCSSEVLRLNDPDTGAILYKRDEA